MDETLFEIRAKLKVQGKEVGFKVVLRLQSTFLAHRHGLTVPSLPPLISNSYWAPMASLYDVQNSSAFRNLNAINIVSFFLATAVWGSNVSNSILFAFRSNQPRSRKLWVAWLWTLTTIGQGLLTSRVEKDYFGWGFISSKISFGREGMAIVILLVSAIVSISSQIFFLCLVRIRRPSWSLLSGFALPPIVFQLVLPLGLLFASPSSSWRDHQKSVMFATLMVNTILNLTIFGAVSTILWPDHFGNPTQVKWKAPLLMRAILYPLHTGACPALFSISSPIMFYYLSSYLNHFLIYQHLLSPLYFMSVLSILDSPLALSAPGSCGARVEDAAWRKTLRSNATGTSRSCVLHGTVGTETLRFDHSSAGTGTQAGESQTSGTIYTERSFVHTSTDTTPEVSLRKM
ncbi:unnamed protein product [Cyclocybe aegerita]|uniref:Uncharacterized protein n=1 Tax=Cyclocybe aegerita TaxID=1973307 RepID=A0A8S0VTG6_CYCAE|nr:unnamed protein product [Cyclocybe aegerita]